MIVWSARSNRTYTLVPYTPLLRSARAPVKAGGDLRDAVGGIANQGNVTRLGARQAGNGNTHGIVDLPVRPVTVEAGRLVAREALEGLAMLHQKGRSEEHTSELQPLMRISYADFSLKNKQTY